MITYISGTIFFRNLSQDDITEKLLQFNDIHADPVFKDIRPTLEGFAVNLLVTVPDKTTIERDLHHLRAFIDTAFGAENLEFVSVAEAKRLFV